MSKIDRMIFPDERVIYRTRMGWKETLGFWLVLFAGCFVIAILAQLLNRNAFDGGAIGGIFGLVIVFTPLIYGAEAVLTDRRVLYRSCIIATEIRDMRLSTIARLDVAGGCLWATDLVGRRQKLSAVPNIDRLALGIANETRVPSPLVLAGRLRVWSRITEGLMWVGFVGGIFGANQVFSNFIFIAKDNFGLDAGVFAALVLVALFLLSMAVGFVVGVLAGLMLAAIIMRVLLNWTDARQIFDYRLQGGDILREESKWVFHLKCARRFAAKLYGQQI